MMNNIRERKNTLVKLALTIILVVLALLGVDIEILIPNESPTVPEVQEVEGCLMVHMIDVGQGDSFLLVQDGKTALIDCGETEEGRNVVEYIKSLGITKLDYVYGTHPHSDHMGGMFEVITNFEIGKIVLPDLEDYKNTKGWYKKLRKELNTGAYDIEIEEVGTIYELGDATMKVIGPINEPGDKPNNYSTVLKVSLGEMDLIFTGDAEKEVEEDILASGEDTGAEILKVGHHGSNTSSTEEFLDAVNPDYALIPNGNKYGHPIKSTMEKLEERNIEVYRTDENGTVICVVTSNNVTFSSEPGSYLSGDEAKARNRKW